MTSLLTTVANQFAKPLLLAGMLPAIITISLLLLVTHPRFPLPLTVPAALKDVDAAWQVTWATLCVAVFAMLLYSLNSSIVRFLSGYPWRLTAIGKAMADRRRTQFAMLRRQRDGLTLLFKDLLPAVNASPDVKEAEERAARSVQVALTPLARTLTQDYPYRESLVLPTKLGNVIRNFEDYSRELYGISSIRLWPRLVGVIDPKYAALIDDAKMYFDFMVNCSVLLASAAILTAWLAARNGDPRAFFVDGGFRVAFFVALAFLAYLAAIERARAWGANVKGAIDLYRRDLLSKLNYTYTLVDIADERERLWSRLSSVWEFPDMLATLEPVPYTPTITIVPVTSAVSANKVVLSIARGVNTPAGKPYPTMKVTLRVENKNKEDATQVTIADVIPAGWTFVWGSIARVGAGAVPTLKGTVPFEMTLPLLAKESGCDITYELQSLAFTV